MLGPLQYGILQSAGITRRLPRGCQVSASLQPLFARKAAPMNISEKITLKSIQTLQPGDIIRDPELKGFGARKRSKNTLTYFVQTRINHQQRYFTIGTHSSPWTPDTARNRAKEILYAAKQGIDPDLHRNHDLELTFETVFQLYMAARGPHLKHSTAKENARIGKVNLIPHFKTKPFVSITREDVVKCTGPWPTDRLPPITPCKSQKLYSTGPKPKACGPTTKTPAPGYTSTKPTTAPASSPWTTYRGLPKPSAGH
jgi:hypothetical protein